MSKRSGIVQAVAAFAFGSSALFLRPTLLSEGGVSRSYQAESTQAPTTQSTIDEKRRPRMIVCSGRVESVHGEFDVSALISGRIEELRVTDGDTVREGDILAVLEGGRQIEELKTAEANVGVARLKLQRVQAGNGKEEIEQGYDDMKALEARLAYEITNLDSLRRLYQKRALANDELERKMHEVEQMKRQRDALQKRYEAVRRGPLPEEIEVARAQLDVAEAELKRARVEHDYHLVRANRSGTVLEIYRHAGDAVNTRYPTPILRVADTSHLRIRLEVNEPDVSHLAPGRIGTFQVRGRAEPAGQLVIKTIVPMFGPRRLFNPDTSVRNDTRTVAMLCEPTDLEIPVLLGQRITASLPVAPLASRMPR
jgi:multidrug efflux pump subunit AcrA (membrane-fusion protein)